uniref:uncharacterized protein LOC122591719 n=1 Tax=Erigeron canadensis TaxID=72917 RepID=UPI001CB9A68F|nr:uncharacterized protein LOC122591719 [Erigeron canadensis]
MSSSNMMGASSSSGAMNQSYTQFLQSQLLNEQFQQFIVASVEEEVEEVPAPPKRLTKKGVAVADKAKWSTQEAFLLAQAWTRASQDSRVGISQDETMFWVKVIEGFNSNRPTGKRNKSQLHGKWSKIKRTTKLFGAILKRLQDQDRQSEADDSQMYKAAHEIYEQNHGPPRFPYEECYNVLKDCPAFWQDHSIAKITAADFIDLGEDEGHVGAGLSVEPNEALNQLFGDDPIRRPPGRNVSRKMSSRSDATSSRGGSSGLEQALGKLEQMLLMKQEQMLKIEDRKRIEEERKTR